MISRLWRTVEILLLVGGVVYAIFALLSPRDVLPMDPDITPSKDQERFVRILTARRNVDIPYEQFEKDLAAGQWRDVAGGKVVIKNRFGIPVEVDYTPEAVLREIQAGGQLKTIGLKDDQSKYSVKMRIIGVLLGFIPFSLAVGIRHWTSWIVKGPARQKENQSQ